VDTVCLAGKNAVGRPAGGTKNGVGATRPCE